MGKTYRSDNYKNKKPEIHRRFNRIQVSLVNIFLKQNNNFLSLLLLLLFSFERVSLLPME